MRVEKSETSWTIYLQNADANAIDAFCLAFLHTTLDQLGENPCTPLIITGTGGYFSTGLNIKSLITYDRAQLKDFMTQFHRLLIRLFSLPVPVVARINGHAIYGGCALAMTADYRVMMADMGKIGYKSTTPLGIGLPCAVIEILRNQVSPQILKKLVLKGPFLSPQEGIEVGIVDETASDSISLMLIAKSKIAELKQIPNVTYKQLKLSLRQPALARMASLFVDDMENWLDTWFSVPGQALLNQQVQKLRDRVPKGPHQK